jgi:UDP-N-acetyl-D-glucosamine dehydrogenase
MQALMKRIRNRQATVGIIGLGYVGLPLALAFRDAGFPVVGFDIDPAKINALMAGRSYFKHIRHERIVTMNPGNGFEATTDFSKLANVDAILICVPPRSRKRANPT